WKQGKSLRHITLHHVDFRGCSSWDAIANCKYLETLEIVFYSNVLGWMVKPLVCAQFNELRKVEVIASSESHRCQELEEWQAKQNKLSCIWTFRRRYEILGSNL